MDTKKILVIEDNPGDVRLIKELIKYSSYAGSEVHSAETLNDGIQMLRQFFFDIILLDLNLSDSAGDETLRSLYSYSMGTPIIVLTGMQDLERSKLFIELGAQDYLPKPKLDKYSLEKSIMYSLERMKMQKSLLGSKERLNDIFKKYADGIVVLSSDKNVSFVNPAAEKLLRKSSDSLINKKFPYKFGSKKKFELDLKQNGKHRYLSCKVINAIVETENSFVISIWDVTETKKAYNYINHINRVLKSIRDINKLIVTETDPIALTKRTVEILYEERSYSSIWLGLFDSEQKLRCFCSSGIEDQAKEFESQLRAGKFPVCISEIFKQKKAVVHNDKAHDCGDCILKNIYNNPCAVIVPIYSGERIYGVLNITEPGSYAINDEELNLLREIAGDLAHALKAIETRREHDELHTKLTWSEKNLRRAQEIAKFGSWEYNYNTGYIYWSQELFEIFGYSLDTHPSLKIILRRIHPDDVNRVGEIYKSVVREKRGYEFDCKILLPDGEVKYLTSKAEVTFDEDTKEFKIFGYAMDITSKRMQEIELEENRKFLNSIFRSAPIGIGVVHNRTLKYVNDRICDMYGYSKEELVGKESDVVYPNKEEFLKAGRERKRLLDKYGISLLETKHMRKDGSLLDVFGSGTKINPDDPDSDIVFTVMDITEMVNMRSDLSKSEEKFTNLIEQSNDIIYLLYKGKFDLINPKFTEILGYTLEDMNDPEFSFLELVAPESIPMIKERSEKSARGEDLSLVYEFTAVSKSGDHVVFETSVSYVKYKDDIATLGILRDITERKAIEQTMKLQSAALSSAANGIVITDPEGVVEWVNPAFTKLCGYTLEEARGNKTSVLKSGKHSNEFYEELWETITSGKVWRGSLINKRKDGSLYNEEMTIAPVTNQEGDIINYIAVKEDVTERLKAEETVRRNQAAFRSLYNLSQFKFDTEEELIKYGLEEVSKIMGSGIGYFHFLSDDRQDISLFAWTKEAEAQCHTVPDSHYSLDQAGIWADCIRTKKTAIHNDYENEPTKKGLPEGHFELERHMSVPLIEDDKVVAVLGVGNKPDEYSDEDVRIVQLFLNELWKLINRMRMQLQLVESEQKFRMLFENATLGIYRTTPQGKVILANPAIIGMLGYDSFEDLPREDIAGKIYADPKDREVFNSIMAAEEVITGFRTKFKRKNGEEFYVQLRARTVQNENGKVDYYEGVVEDETSQVEAENSLREAKEKAEAADKLKTEFIAQMSHEVGTPLNILLSYSDILKDEISQIASDDYSEYFKAMNSAGRRIERTMKLILNFSQANTGNYEVNYTQFDLVREILDHLKSEYELQAKEKNLKFELTTDVEKALVKADQYSVQQIFANLVDNAIKYTEEGFVKILVSDHDSGKLKVDIMDSGIGIADEFSEKIWEPFSQEFQGYTRQYDGNGLGLSLVRKYCQFNKAEISYTTKKDNGTTFTVLLGR